MRSWKRQNKKSWRKTKGKLERREMAGETRIEKLENEERGKTNLELFNKFFRLEILKLSNQNSAKVKTSCKKTQQN